MKTGKICETGTSDGSLYPLINLFSLVNSAMLSNSVFSKTSFD